MSLKMSRMQFAIELRGQLVEVDCEVDPADRSVGIMSAGCAEEILSDADGKPLAWVLTNDEIEKLDRYVDQAVWDGYFDDPDY